MKKRLRITNRAVSALDGSIGFPFFGGLLLLVFICVWATCLGGFSINRPLLHKAMTIKSIETNRKTHTKSEPCQLFAKRFIHIH